MEAEGKAASFLLCYKTFLFFCFFHFLSKIICKSIDIHMGLWLNTYCFESLLFLNFPV